MGPKHKHISGKDTFSVRIKILRAKEHFTNTDKDYEAFKELVNDSDLLSGIDNQSALEDDEAYELALPYQPEWCRSKLILSL